MSKGIRGKGQGVNLVRVPRLMRVVRGCQKYVKKVQEVSRVVKKVLRGCQEDVKRVE